MEFVNIFKIYNTNSICIQFTGDPWLQTDDYSMKLWTFPNYKREKLKYAIFKDLWHKKFFITNGNKFGGDYLVYYGM